jgi:hypothetical protein
VNGLVGNDLLVTILENGNERNVVVSKKGAQKLDAPEFAHGGYMAEGGNVPFQKQKLAKKIKNFYVDTFPNDTEGKRINSKATFGGLLKALSNDINVYEYIGVGDSIIRERVFGKLANILNVDYDIIYDKWSLSEDLPYDENEFAKGGKLIGKQKNLDVNKNGKLDAQDFKMLRGKMAMGGETKFKDKVQSIKASLLKRKKVSPSVQKDYGKTYSPKEAEDSAKRIVGSIVKKKEKMAKGGLVSNIPKFKKLQQLEDKILHSRNRARNFIDWNEGSIGTNYRMKWQKMIKKLRGWDDNASISEQINNTKQEWKEYCKEVGLVEDYNFGDVIS